MTILEQFGFLEQRLQEKPVDWPMNYMEAFLTKVYEAVHEMFHNPSPENIEKVYHLIIQENLNEVKFTGLMRLNSYGSHLINLLYLYAVQMCFPELKLFCYKVLIVYVEADEECSIIANAKNIDYQSIDISKLYPILLIFSAVYGDYRFTYQDRSFWDVLIDSYKHLYDINAMDTCTVFTFLLSTVYDLSYNSSYRINDFLKYDKEVIIRLFNEFAFYCKQDAGCIYQHNILTNIVVILSNMILKLRTNELDSGTIYKYISTENFQKVFNNGQVWIHCMNILNDSSEGVEEQFLFDNPALYPSSWKVKEVFNPHPRFVCCFSRNQNKKEMAKYGNVQLAYTTDNIATFLAPMLLDDDNLPFFGRVLCFDVSYSKEQAEEEIKFAMQLIDKLPFEGKIKKAIMYMLKDYWTYSVKDESWKDEKERRYVIYFRGKEGVSEGVNYTYDTEWLKLDTSLYMDCDAYDGNNIFKDYLFKRRKGIYETRCKKFKICKKCLKVDFSNVKSTCENCGGTDFYICE